MNSFVLRLVLFVVVVVFTGCLADNPQMSISPAHNIQEGMEITVTCTVTLTSALDVFKILRTVNGIDYEITTKNSLSDYFKKTQRYSIDHYDKAKGEVQLKIIDVKPADAGHIRCIHSSTRHVAEEYLHVYAAPKSVVIQHKNYLGEVSDIQEGGDVLLREDMDGAVMCKISTDSVDAKPQVKITFDDEDVTDLFTSDVKINEVTTKYGLLTQNYTVVYELLAAEARAEHNGRLMTCQALVENFTPISTYIHLEVQYYPLVDCVPKQYSKLGVAHEISCIVHSNPTPVLANWSWGKKPNRTILPSMQSDGEYSAEEEVISQDKTKYTLLISDVADENFRRYKLEVDNSIGTTDAAVKLGLEVEEVVTYKNPPTAGSATEKSVTVKDMNAGASHDGSASHHQSVLFSFLMFSIAGIISSL